MNKKKILLIEDEPNVLYMMKEMLEILNCEVTVATLGEQAVDISRAQFFDFYFVDIVMPDMNGFEVIEKMMEKEILSKIVVTSGSLDKNNLKKAREIGIENFLAKPIKMYDLEKFFKQKSLEDNT